MHFVKGKPRGSGKRRTPAPAVTYPPGHFTKGCGWLKGWAPTDWGKPNTGSTLGGHKAVEMGTAFGGRVTIDLPGTPGNRKPGTMR